MAANPRRGDIALNIDGREYVVRPSLERLAMLEEYLGIAEPSGYVEALSTGSVARWLRIGEIMTGEKLGDIALGCDVPAIQTAVMAALTFGYSEGNGQAAPASGKT